jgi:two-component system OmpR family sensor kinase
VTIESRPPAGDGSPAAAAARRKPPLAGIRTRVLVFFLVLLVISTAASVLVLREVLMARIGTELERELTEHVEPLRTLSEAGPPGTNEPFENARALLRTYLDQTSPPPDGAVVAFVDGRPFGGGSVAPPGAGLEEALAGLAGLSDIRAPRSGGVDTAAGEARYVAVPVAVGESRGVLVAAALTDAERAQVESAVGIAIGASAVVLLLASLFIWLAAGRAIAPLQALSRTARAISETDLSRRIPVTGGDEIAELARTFNGMLDRLEAAFAGQKDFLSDVSHDLRTPITIIRGHLETLGDTPLERQQAIALIQDELDRMSRYVNDLLLLSKAPRPDFLRLAPVDLDLFTHDLFAKARSLGDRDWHLDGTGVGIVVADQHRLTQAVMNLAENAVEHSGAGDPIWLGSSLVGNRARMWVTDNGPGIDPAEQERIFDRFVRGGDPRWHIDGAGLGLAIVRAVAEAHGGSIEVESRPGIGSTFAIVLPVTPAP